VRVGFHAAVVHLYLASHAGIPVLSKVSSRKLVRALPSFDKTLTNDLSA
jgi:hypothetical protein